ncbi:MAG: helix-turn-helix transcriptional regulator [Marmoricola sp.]
MGLVSTPPTPLSRWELVHLLAEPTRRQVFECVRAASDPVTREEAAAATGVNQRLATFHLDRLLGAGLLVTDFARPEGRTGPGAGRPAKRYRPADVELDLTLPPRQYELATRLLARAIQSDPRDAETSSFRVARDEGRRIGELRRTTGGADATADLVESLIALGYEPAPTAAETVRLRNCPFRSAAEVAPELVCGMNCELVAGLLEGLGLDPSAAELDPDPPYCCVTVAVR